MEEDKDEESIVEDTINGILPGLGDLVKRLKQHSPELQKGIEDADREIKDRIKKGHSRKPRISYSCSVRTLVPESSEGGGTRKKEPEFLEPVVDVMDEETAIRIIAELPGMDDEDICTELDNGSFILEAQRGTRRYRKIVPVPHNAEMVYRRYKNGILEVELKKDGT